MSTISLKNLLLTVAVLVAVTAACVASYRAGMKSTALERTGPHETGPIDETGPIGPLRTSIGVDSGDAAGSADAPKWPN